MEGETKRKVKKLADEKISCTKEQGGEQMTYMGKEDWDAWVKDTKIKCSKCGKSRFFNITTRPKCSFCGTILDINSQETNKEKQDV